MPHQRKLWIIATAVLVLSASACLPNSGQISIVAGQGQTVTATPTVTLASANLLADENVFIDVYRRVNPSVVNIMAITRSSRATMQALPQGPVGPSPYMQEQQSEGSGFVWDDQGHVVTNNHVVENASYIEVTFADFSTVEASLIGSDPHSDIAVIKVDPTAVAVQPVTLGDSDQLIVGQLAIAIGNPYGQVGTMTRGIVSALGRTFKASTSQFSITEMIQTDAPINPGNSGGPLLDSSGQVIGINTLILSQTGSSAGVGFAVPINTAKVVVPNLIQTGKYDYPAPRGLPQVEVAFDIDANGILNVSATDKATGREQKITITASTNLSKEEVERLREAARRHASEDQIRRNLVEARNEADTLAYQIEKTLRESGDRINAADRQAIEGQIANVRRVAQGEDVGAIRQAIEELKQASYSLSQQMYGQPGEAGSQYSGDGAAQPETEGEDVVEGEFREV